MNISISIIIHKLNQNNNLLRLKRRKKLSLMKLIGRNIIAVDYLYILNLNIYLVYILYYFGALE